MENDPPSPIARRSPSLESPPTSPIALSPPSSPVNRQDHGQDESMDADTEHPTSPEAQRSSPIRSPPTSPLAYSPRSSSHSSDSSWQGISPLKRKRPGTNQVSRRTLRRLKQVEKDSAAKEDQDIFESNAAESASTSIHQYETDDSSAGDGSTSSRNESDPEDSSSATSTHSASPRSFSPSSSQSENNASTGSDLGTDSSDDEEISPIYEGSPISVNEALYDVLKVYVDEKWTKSSLNKNIKLIKRLLPQPNEFPSSGKAALQVLKGLTVNSYGEKEYFYCSECNKLVGNASDMCVNCDSPDNLEAFYVLPPQVQIRHLFEQRDLANIIDSHRENNEKKEGFICDITDGSVYCTVKESLNGPYDIVLLWNTDGVALSGSSKQELWPILATICEIPPRLRPSFMIVLGVFVSSKKPDMNQILKPLVECLKDCFEKGVSWVHPVTGASMVSKIVAPMLSADAPAKAMVSKCMRFNARYGCNVCEQKTKKIELTELELRENEAQINPRKRIKRKRKFLFQEDTGQAKLRSGVRMDAQGALAEERQKPRKGVLGPAVVSEIPFFDRACGITAEYLHLFLLGVVKYFLQKIFFEKGPWYVGNKIAMIENFISQIEVPDFVKRLPRGISEFKFWKASEFRNFLLYYLLPLFKEISLPDDYFQHWFLLCASTHILLREAISEDDLKSCDIMLKAFVRDVGALYGPACYTYDIHNLIHVSLLVRRCGPLWATSAFTFESFNGFISNQVHGTKHLGRELINNINISQSISILGNMVKAAPERSQTATSAPELFGKPKDSDILSQEEIDAIAGAGLENVS